MGTETRSWVALRNKAEHLSASLTLSEATRPSFFAYLSSKFHLLPGDSFPYLLIPIHIVENGCSSPTGLQMAKF
jgi:hypothetical protein